jgi:Zn-dependent M32 family carboxypeptidase
MTKCEECKYFGKCQNIAQYNDYKCFRPKEEKVITIIKDKINYLESRNTAMSKILKECEEKISESEFIQDYIGKFRREIRDNLQVLEELSEELKQIKLEVENDGTQS